MNDDNNIVDIFKPLYKQHRRIKRNDLGPDILDCKCKCTNSFESSQYSIQTQSTHLPNYQSAINSFLNTSNKYADKFDIITINELPGFKIIPNLLPPEVQHKLVDLTLSNYVQDEQHVSNLTPFYELPHPFNLFPNQSYTLKHKQGKADTTIEKVRNKQLRWITLGGQYDWTAKVYPTFEPGAPKFPAFPNELRELLYGIFGINSQAAIINFYSPGDILSPHQDVAELSNKDLISVSIGCDCVFYVGNERHANEKDDKKPFQMVLGSGDAVVMAGESRCAYHGVGRVFEDTVPEYLITENTYYNDWIKTKRLNLNVRQMLDN